LLRLQLYRRTQRHPQLIDQDLPDPIPEVQGVFYFWVRRIQSQFVAPSYPKPYDKVLLGELAQNVRR